MINSKKMIIGFVGQLASGKGTAAAYLKEKYGAGVYRFSTILRDVVDRLYIPQSRENLQRMSSLLRSNFGEDVFARVIAEEVKKDPKAVIAIDGIRRPDDVKYLKEIPGFALVHIFADMEKRYERIVSRGENTDDTMKTFESFKKDHEGEAELKIVEIAKEAKEEIDNNGTVQDLYRQLDALVTKYASQD